MFVTVRYDEGEEETTTMRTREMKFCCSIDDTNRLWQVKKIFRADSDDMTIRFLRRAFSQGLLACARHTV